MYVQRANYEGLSPPTRGNHWRGVRRQNLAGSIPAHAGEPKQWTARRLPPPVYPRPRGGTFQHLTSFFSAKGLSPPTRGNPYLHVFC